MDTENDSKNLKESPINEKGTDGAKTVVAPPALVWNLTIYDIRRYGIIFRKLAKDKNEVDFSSMKNYLLENGSVVDNFDSIWKVCDPYSLGKITNEQFIVAMWLIDQDKEKDDIEKSLNFDDSGMPKRFSEAITKSNENNIVSQELGITDNNNDQLKMTTSISPSRTDEFILKTLKRLKVQAEEFQNTFYKQEQQILQEQEQNNHCFLNLKTLREHLLEIQKKFSDDIKEVQKLIFEVEDKKFASENFEKTISDDIHHPSKKADLSNPFNTDFVLEAIKSYSPATEITEGTKFNQISSIYNTTNPFLKSFNQCTSMSESVTPTDIQLSPRIGPLDFSNSFEMSAKSNEYVVNSTKPLSQSSPKVKISVNPSSVLSIKLTIESFTEKKED